MRGRRGFTLVELTIAVVLLAIGLLALTGALARALHAAAAARVGHAALREAESIADSLVLAGTASAGSRAGRGFRVEWRTVGCAGAACVRVVAYTASDSFPLTARPAPRR